MAFQTLQNAICLERNREMIGQNVEVMIEEINGHECKGRTPTNHIVHFASQECSLVPGNLVRVTIDHAGKHSLKGKFQAKC